MDYQFFCVTDREQWDSYLSSVEAYDFYHTWEYHALQAEGEARLLVFQNNRSLLLLPLLIRSIPHTSWFDATSVYGYAGWVGKNPSFSAEVYQTLRQYCREQRIVSVFSRLHPLLPYAACFPPELLFHCHTTLAINVGLPVEEQFKQYSESVRRSIRKNLGRGMTVEQTSRLGDILCFARLYRQSMQRKHAEEHYLFSDDYFIRFMGADSFVPVLLLAQLDGRVVGGALFTCCKGIMQYHLGAVAEGCTQLSPLKVLIDEARHIANNYACKHFHLGGGHGERNDSLYVFKSRMGSLTYPFYTLRWIIFPAVYQSLSAGKKLAAYFPLYRCIDE